jgi:uncharacterized membrane protein
MKASWTAVLTVALAACGGRSPAPSPPAQGEAAAPVALRGTLLVRGDSSLAFVACGTTLERTLTAPAASQLTEAVAAVNGGVRDSLFAEFTADTAGGVIVARETRFAAPLAAESHCDHARGPFDWEALGTEPFWRVTLDSAQLVLERPEPPRELVFDASPSETRGALTTIIARRTLGALHELKLGLLREPCHDGVSNAWYPYRAEVRVGDTALHGCARR